MRTPWRGYYLRSNRPISLRNRAGIFSRWANKCRGLPQGDWISDEQLMLFWKFSRKATSLNLPKSPFHSIQGSHAMHTYQVLQSSVCNQLDPKSPTWNPYCIFHGRYNPFAVFGSYMSFRDRRGMNGREAFKLFATRFSALQDSWRLFWKIDALAGLGYR